MVKCKKRRKKLNAHCYWSALPIPISMRNFLFSHSPNRLLSLKLSKVEFICLILKNAYYAKVPPPPPMPKKEVQGGTSDWYRQSRLCPLLNGAVLPSSPLKAQSEILVRPVRKGSTGSLVSVDIKDEKEVLVVEDGKEVLGRSTLQVPPGIPFSLVSVGGACRDFPLARTDSTGSYDSGGLLDTDVLREWMLLITAAQGLEGVSMECANLSINGLDAYLKKLIKSCVEMVGARCGRDLSKNNS
ncbi:uncharacterized protein LOC142644406 [Castanea sativa]|uniref:uncharacterized protein LOC142644406 n=1 Tax=Castanea sativa TaxID=21020 RepID=UPI003F64C913